MALPLIKQAEPVKTLWVRLCYYKTGCACSLMKQFVSVVQNYKNFIKNTLLEKLAL